MICHIIIIKFFSEKHFVSGIVQGGKYRRERKINQLISTCCLRALHAIMDLMNICRCVIWHRKRHRLAEWTISYRDYSLCTETGNGKSPCILSLTVFQKNYFSFLFAIVLKFFLKVYCLDERGRLTLQVKKKTENQMQ